jgi:MFS family permease
VTAASTSAPAVVRLAPLVAIVFLGFIAVGLPLPAIPRHVHDALGFGPVVVGWAVGVQSLVTILTRGIAGSISDGRGPKLAVLIGMPVASLAGAAYLGAAALAAHPHLSLAVLVVGRVAMGVSESLFLVGCMAWGIARVGQQNTGKVMAWQGIAMYSAVGLGAPAGLMLQERIGFGAVGAAVVVLPLIGFLVALRLPGIAPGGLRPRGGFLKMVRAIWPLGLAVALGTAPFAIMYAFLSLYFDDRGWSGAGLAMFGLAAGFVAVRVLFGHLPDKISGPWAAIASLGVQAVGQLLLWTSGVEALALVGSVLTGAGFSLVFPSFGVQVVRKTPPELRGSAMGAYMAFFDLALGLTGPIAGLAAGRYGFASVFLLGVVACVAAAGVALATRERPA